jgi:hypothetical protein
VLGSYDGETIAGVVKRKLSSFSIHPLKLGYFVLDNALNNDTAVAELSRIYGFIPAYRRLRCSPYIFNLIGQMLIGGKDKDAYDNDAAEHEDEEIFMEEWRKEGPLGVLTDVINYMRTPQQYELFQEFQQIANRSLPTHEQIKILKPIKPVVTRWNSFYASFKRATRLHSAYDAYINHHVRAVAAADATAILKGNNKPKVAAWMRSGGLTAADWGVITQYMDALKPLKSAAERLEGRGSGKYGAIYEVIPVFEYLLSSLEAIAALYEHVNFNAYSEAPEDHLLINVKAAWHKANEYYNKLDDSPVYYAATRLYPYYKDYCSNSWRDKAGWIARADVGFQQLWAEYKPAVTATPPRPKASTIDEAIAAFVGSSAGHNVRDLDEYEQWSRYEPAWTTEQYDQAGSPVQYWLRMSSKYPNLSRFAIDIMTIPASSCDCERMFSELGDLLEPKRRGIGPQLLAAIQMVRAWRKAGFYLPLESDDDSEVTDAEIRQEFHIGGWDGLTD